MIRRGTRVLRAAAVLVALSLQSPAFCADYAGKRVAEVRFEPPVQPIPTAELLSRIPIQVGEEFRQSSIRRGIENLYQTGRFEDITVDAVEQDGQVILTFITVNRWFVGGQLIEGEKDPPSKTQLLNSTKLNLGEEFTEGGLHQAVENMTSVLRANGFFEAKVDTEINRQQDTEQVDVRYLVEPGIRAKFTDPVIRGQTQQTVAEVIKAAGWKRLFGWGGYRPITESRVESGIQKIRRSLEKKDLLMSKVLLMGMEWKPDLKAAVPSIEIIDGPKVELRVEGFRLSKRKQRELIPIFEERSVDRELLAEGSRSLEAHLQTKGYFDASADFTTTNKGDAQSITYSIDRGLRYKLANLAITGSQYFDIPTIRERLIITPATPVRYRHGRFSEQMLQDDKAAIEDLYRSNGFLDVKVNSEVNTGFKNKERLQSVEIEIEEGKQYLIGKLEISGLSPEGEEFVHSLMQSSEGQPFSNQTLAVDRETVLNAFFNQGYTGAAFDWTAQRGNEPNRVDVKVEIKQGTQVFVRQVLVGGLNRTDPKLVYSRISLRPGDPLSLGQMLDSQKRLYDLGIFARVDTAIQNPAGNEEEKYVLFEVEEAKKYSFNIGVGAQVGRIGGGSVENFDSPAGAAGFSPRVNIGLTRNNFLGLGQSITSQARLSNIQRRAQTTYLVPHFRDRDDLSLSVSALYDDSNDVRTFAATRIEGAIQLTRRLSRANTVQGRYVLRRVSVDPESLKIEPQLIPRLAQPVRLGIFAGTFIQDRRDDPIESKKGFYNSVDAGMAMRAIGSESNFARILARNSTYHRVGKDLVFARSVTFGFQDRLTGGPLEDVPLPERFFAGGASSHRGFPENQAGPRDPTTGFPIGGKALLIFNHELRYPLIGDNLGGVLFHDMGNVYSRIGAISFRFNQHDLQDFDYMVQAVGLGFRYRTPIGPIRIDLAYAPNSPRFIGFEGTREELLFGQGRQTLQRISQFQFHFSLGQAF